MHSDTGLERFIAAQVDSYSSALEELREGAKRGHWMWFIFPQIAGLGTSATAQFYALRDLDEARAYLAHPVLGDRLIACTAAVSAHADMSAEAMLGGIDAVKLRSSMTLFEHAAADATKARPFAHCLDTLFGGRRDERTLALLK